VPGSTLAHSGGSQGLALGAAVWGGRLRATSSVPYGVFTVSSVDESYACCGCYFQQLLDAIVSTSLTWCASCCVRWNFQQHLPPFANGGCGLRSLCFCTEEGVCSPTRFFYSWTFEFAFGGGRAFMGKSQMVSCDSNTTFATCICWRPGQFSAGSFSGTTTADGDNGSVRTTFYGHYFTATSGSPRDGARTARYRRGE
jgi:hypothetical protein